MGNLVERTRRSFTTILKADDARPALFSPPGFSALVSHSISSRFAIRTAFVRRMPHWASIPVLKQNSRRPSFLELPTCQSKIDCNCQRCCYCRRMKNRIASPFFSERRDSNIVHLTERPSPPPPPSSGFPPFWGPSPDSGAPVFGPFWPLLPVRDPEISAGRPNEGRATKRGPGE